MAALPNISAPLYLPPGRTADLRTWTKEDVFNWMAFFMPEQLRQETIDALQELEPFDGDVLKMMLRLKPHPTIFGISQEAMDLIVMHLESVAREFRLVGAQPNPAPPNPVNELPPRNPNYSTPRH